ITDPARNSLSPLSLHDALPISPLTTGEGPQTQIPGRGAQGLVGRGVSGSDWATRMKIIHSFRMSESNSAGLPVPRGQPRLFWLRSEEHTSELQSLRHLVCRLLL